MVLSGVTRAREEKRFSEANWPWRVLKRVFLATTIFSLVRPEGVKRNAQSA